MDNDADDITLTGLVMLDAKAAYERYISRMNDVFVGAALSGVICAILVFYYPELTKGDFRGDLRIWERVLGTLVAVPFFSFCAGSVLLPLIPPAANTRGWNIAKIIYSLLVIGWFGYAAPVPISITSGVCVLSGYPLRHWILLPLRNWAYDAMWPIAVIWSICMGAAIGWCVGTGIDIYQNGLKSQDFSLVFDFAWKGAVAGVIVSPFLYLGPQWFRNHAELVGDWIYRFLVGLRYSIPGCPTNLRFSKLAAVLVYLGIAFFAAEFLFYLWTWQPPPEPPAAKTTNHLTPAMMQLIWNFAPLKLAETAAAVYVVYLSIGAAFETLFHKQQKDVHGDARIATARELYKAGLIPYTRGSIYLGKLLSDKGRAGREIGYRGGNHLLTIGKTGAGKDTGLIVPNLATLRRSILVIDPKGEAAAITARARADFSDVVILNPLGVGVKQGRYFDAVLPWMASDGFNPLASIEAPERCPDGTFAEIPDSFVSDCTNIAVSMIEVKAHESQPHFAQSAQEMACGLIMWECATHEPEDRSLGRVRDQITMSPGRNEGGEPLGLLKIILEIMESGLGPARNKIERFVRSNTEMENIRSSASNQTGFLDMPFRDDLEKGLFDFGDMKRCLTTVYLIVPTDELKETTGGKWLRVVLTAAIRDLMRTPNSGAPVLIIGNEFGNVGNLEAGKNVFTIGRGHGIQMWLFLQNMGQLRDTYGEAADRFLANADVFTAFRAPDLPTAKYMSERGGQKTEIVESGSESRVGGQLSYNPQGMPLFRPEALMQMDDNEMLVWVGKNRPFRTICGGYWKTRFRYGMEKNPYYNRG